MAGGKIGAEERSAAAQLDGGKAAVGDGQQRSERVAARVALLDGQLVKEATRELEEWRDGGGGTTRGRGRRS